MRIRQILRIAIASDFEGCEPVVFSLHQAGVLTKDSRRIAPMHGPACRFVSFPSCRSRKRRATLVGIVCSGVIVMPCSPLYGESMVFRGTVNPSSSLVGADPLLLCNLCMSQARYPFIPLNTQPKWRFVEVVMQTINVATGAHVEAKTRARRSASVSAADCSNSIFGHQINCIERAASTVVDSRGNWPRTYLKSLLSPLTNDPDACSQGRTTISRARK